MNQNIHKRVNATLADSNGQQNRKLEEPDARNGSVRICMRALGGIRGATRLLRFARPSALIPFARLTFAIRSE